jgi:hypothetical protein
MGLPTWLGEAALLCWCRGPLTRAMPLSLVPRSSIPLPLDGDGSEKLSDEQDVVYGSYLSHSPLPSPCFLNLQGGSEKLSDEAVEETLEKVVKLLAYVSDKDLFAGEAAASCCARVCQDKDSTRTSKRVVCRGEKGLLLQRW